MKEMKSLQKLRTPSRMSTRWFLNIRNLTECSFMPCALQQSSTDYKPTLQTTLGLFWVGISTLSPLLIPKQLKQSMPLDGLPPQNRAILYQNNQIHPLLYNYTILLYIYKKLKDNLAENYILEHCICRYYSIAYVDIWALYM